MIKQEGLYQNKVNSCLGSIHNCKMAYLNSIVMARTEGSKQYASTSTRQFSFTLFKMSLYLDTERAFKKS